MKCAPATLRLPPLCLGLILLAVAFSGTADIPQGTHLFRIGTGGEKGTYFPVATVLAEGLSDSGKACDRDGQSEKTGPDAGCGVPGLLGVAQLSNGSVTNVMALASGLVEACLTQADVAYWAHSGTGIFADVGELPNLRAIASLYPESVHIVARKEAGLKSVRDLKGHRVSLDEPGSGTLVGARAILSAYGLKESDLRPIYLKPKFAAQMLARGKLDAFFTIGGYPATSVAEVVSGGGATLIPVTGPGAARAVAENPFFRPDVIPAGVYRGIDETGTLQVHGLLLVTEDMDPQLVYEITRALWSNRTLGFIRAGHPKGAEIKRASALLGISVPLHPGAERYYRETGYLDDNRPPQNAGVKGE
jgi:uncharacterized protein